MIYIKHEDDGYYIKAEFGMKHIFPVMRSYSEKAISISICNDFDTIKASELQPLPVDVELYFANKESLEILINWLKHAHDRFDELVETHNEALEDQPRAQEPKAKGTRNKRPEKS